MTLRKRLSSWSLPVLLFGVPLCAALALEQAGAAGEKDRSRNQAFGPAQRESPMPAAPAKTGPKRPEISRPASR